MTNLTNTELQAAISATINRGSSLYLKHLEVLHAEQIRRLNAEEIAVEIEPAVDEWEYVLAYWSVSADRLIKSTYNANRESVVDLSLIGNALANNASTEFGLYKRPLNSDDRWKLITYPNGVLPETVEEIN